MDIDANQVIALLQARIGALAGECAMHQATAAAWADQAAALAAELVDARAATTTKTK